MVCSPSHGSTAMSKINTEQSAKSAKEPATKKPRTSDFIERSPPKGTKTNTTTRANSPKKRRKSEGGDADQPSTLAASASDISAAGLDQSLTTIVSEIPFGPSSPSISPKKKSSQRPSSFTFSHISVASLFRRSFTRIKERHSQHSVCKPCYVQLERIKYEKVLPLVVPEYPVSFTYLLNSWDLEVAAKIGEGSFSEVFCVTKVEPLAGHAYVIKVVPVGEHGQPRFEDLLPEMCMSLAGRNLLESDINRAPTFIGLQGLHLARGQYTPEMVAACEQFALDNPGEAEHPLPTERPVDQYFIVFFTSYDGVELESTLPVLTPAQKCSIVLQITLGLAAAEAAFDFEHRDMHLSNLVVSDYPSIRNGSPANSLIEFRVEGRSHWVNSFGKKVALIDYGMSRLVVDETLYTSFSSSILEGRNMQRKTYREQHELVGGNGGYRTARPETNGLWIKFLICKLFPKRPVNPSKASYAAQVNRLYEVLSTKAVCARSCIPLIASVTESH
ncbi:serine/threonine-protein kinase haspin-like [Tropilaelaps mercedesae]|uniref:Serine/threonine-protein kinase haspin-like n=1 Tax=Tropilaelaps mercedesae TaxID=418985 RepID=A0A1V9XX81_9ACAR|nr:serine/threonine-protein kinase haspin-like [Tropilaelaps mercedesae]